MLGDLPRSMPSWPADCPEDPPTRRPERTPRRAKLQALAAVELHHTGAFEGCRWPVERVSVGGELVARQGAGGFGSWWKQEIANGTAHSPPAAKRRSAVIIRWLTLKDGKMGLYDNRYRLCVSLNMSIDIVGWSRTAANSHLARSVAGGDGLVNSGKPAYLLSLQLRVTKDKTTPTAVSMESLEAEAIATALEKMWVSPEGKVRARSGPVDGDPAVPTHVSHLKAGLTFANSEDAVDDPVVEGTPPVPPHCHGTATPQPHKRMAPERLVPEPDLDSEAPLVLDVQHLSASLVPSILKSPGTASTRTGSSARKGSRFSIGSKRHKSVKFPQDDHHLRMVYPYLLEEREKQGKREALAQLQKARQLESAEEDSAKPDDGDDWCMLGRLPSESTPASSGNVRRPSLRESLRERFVSCSDSHTGTSTGSSDEDDSSSSEDDSSSSDDDSSSSEKDGGHAGETATIGERRGGSVTRHPPPM